MFVQVKPVVPQWMRLRTDFKPYCLSGNECCDDKAFERIRNGSIALPDLRSSSSIPFFYRGKILTADKSQAFESARIYRG
jgi:hypothetical protein